MCIHPLILSFGASTPAYVEKVIKNGGKYGDGILIYVHPNPSTESEKYIIIKDEFCKTIKFKKMIVW